MQKIYIVDDDAAVRTSLTFFLRAMGYTVQPCSSGLELVAGLGRLQPGCVLLHIRMPSMDGFEVIADLTPYRARLPIVVMTEHGDIATAVRVIKAGAVDFVEKPFAETLLLEVLSKVFESLEGQVRDHDRRALATARLASLTGREREVLRGLIAGHSNKILAYDLGISIRTIEMHRAATMKRLGARTLAETLRIAFDGGVQPSSCFASERAA